MLLFILMTIGLSANVFGQSTASLSQPVYEGKVKVTHRYVPMRDGVELALRITRPDAEWTYPGGVLRPYMFDSYSPLMTAFNFAPPDPEIAGVRWSEIWQHRLENNRPWGIGYISHPTEGPYWQDRSLAAGYSRVKCPVFVVAGWSDVYPTALLRAFDRLDVPFKKAMVGPWGHWYGEEKHAVFEPEAMEPGEVYELGVDVKEMSYVFAAGHRIRVAIAGADIQNAWPTSQAAVNTVHRSRRYPSHILLPVIPEQSPKLPKPDLVELPTADPELLKRPLEYSITHDLVGNAVTVRLGSQMGGVRGEGSDRAVTRSRFTVSEANPADAVLAATSKYVIKRPDSEIEVQANEVTSSDKAAFHHVVDVEVTVNGARHFQKSWSVTVPRKLN